MLAPQAAHNGTDTGFAEGNFSKWQGTGLTG